MLLLKLIRFNLPSSAQRRQKTKQHKTKENKMKTTQKTNMAGIANCTSRDYMTATHDAKIWHRSYDAFESISLKDKSFALNNWEVVQSELLLPNKKGSGVFILTGSDDGQRIGKPFEETYSVFSNKDTVYMIEAIIAKLEKLGVHPEIVTSGSVENREKTFVTIKIPENEKFIIDGREFKLFLDILNGFGGKSKVVLNNSNVCVCCANTYKMALHDDSGAFRFSVPHRRNLKAMISEVVELIPAAFESSLKCNREFENHLKNFAQFPIGLTDCENVFAWFLGQSAEPISTRTANQINRLQALFVRGKGNKGETAFDLFQAATEYYTHESAGESDDVTKQFDSSEFGSGAEKKQLFFSALCELVNSKEKFAAAGRIGETILLAYRKGKK